MRAWAVVENGKDLQEVEFPTPEPTGTEILLEVTHCGVCHSDLHIWDGYYDIGSGKQMSLKDRGVVLPLAMGHEIVGRVVKLGPEATGVAVGDIRIVFPWLGCGKCDRCLAEEDNMCLVSRALGVFQNGGYATHVLAPQSRHLIDPGTIDPALAATYACSGVTVYSAIQKVMPMAPDKAIVLIGAGGLGLAAISVLKALGHRAIVSVDVSEEKRQAALTAGATSVVDANGEGVVERITAACGGAAEAIIDLVNGSSTAAVAFVALRKGGKLIQVGLFGGELTVALPLMAMRGLTIQGSYVGNPKELRELVALAQDGKLQPVPITEMPQPRANEALMRLRDGRLPAGGAYRRLTDGWGLAHVVLLSLEISGGATLMAALIGLPLGAGLAIRRFAGRGAVILVANALLGLPPVVVGLGLYLALSRSGPLSAFGLLFTPGAMLLAQVLLALPIVVALSHRASAGIWRDFGDELRMEGAGLLRSISTVLAIGREAVLTTVLAAFGRTISEVGAIIIVGGNIAGATRTMTTSIVLETSKGNLGFALALGAVLVLVSLAVSAAGFIVAGRTIR